MVKKRNKYTAEFKQEAVGLVMELAIAMPMQDAA